jgi:hypothetical protein
VTDLNKILLGICEFQKIISATAVLLLRAQIKSHLRVHRKSARHLEIKSALTCKERLYKDNVQRHGDRHFALSLTRHNESFLNYINNKRGTVRVT